jgi:prepilin-type N-terminal cleavage/methylation domain-containing protein
VKNPRGFTFIEMVMTLAVLGILFSVAGVSLSKLQQSLTTSASDREITYILTSAARKARHGLRGTPWGVYIPYDAVTRVSTGTVTVFSGTSYAARNTAYDVIYTINDDIRFTTVDFSGAAANTTSDHEIVFSALTGATTQYGSITVTWFNNSRTLNVSADGIMTR